MADRYLVPGGNGVWTSTTNWSATSGGAAGASVPGTSDAVFFDSNSANTNITVSSDSSCLSITASNYTGTLTVDATLTAASGFTFSAGMGYAGTGTLTITNSTSAPVTSNGVVITGTLRIASSAVLTLLDNLTVDTLTTNATSGNITINTSNGSVLRTQSLIAPSQTSGDILGTAKIELIGTGTVSFPALSSGYANIDIDINSTSTTFLNKFGFLGKTLRYLSGTVDASASTLTVYGSSTFDTDGMEWGIVTLLASSNPTLTLLSDLNVAELSTATNTVTISGSFVVNAGTLRFTSTTGAHVFNGSTINTESIASTSISSGTIQGTTAIVLVGTGTISMSTNWSGFMSNNLSINSTSTTFASNFRYQGTLTYQAGTVDTSNYQLILVGSSTLNTSGMTWNDVLTPTGTTTLTLSSNFNTTTLTVPSGSVTTTISGAFSINTSSLVYTTSSGTSTFNGGTINAESISSTSLSSGTLTGTTKIVLVGTGTMSFPSGWSGVFSHNLDINSTLTTLVGNFRYSTRTITYIAGTVDVTDSTLVLVAAATMNTAGMDWGNVLISSALTLTLTSAFTCSGTFTIPSSNLTVSGTGFWTRVGNLTFTGSSNTLSLLNNLTVTGTLTTSTATTINNNSLLIANLNAVGTISGTTTVVFNSTGTWSGDGILTNNTTINTSGTLTISGIVRFRTRTLTYTAGTVDSSNGVMYFDAASTINTGGMTWSFVRVTGTQTLSSNLNVSGTTTITGTATFVNTGRFTQTGNLELLNATAFTLINNITVLNDFISTNNGNAQTMTGFQLIVNGGITTTGLGNTAGTTTILLNGTGTWQSSGGTNAIRNNTTINTAGTITFSGDAYFNTGTLTYTAGTVVTTGSTLNCLASTTLNTNGITWNNVYFSGTITLSSNLAVTGITSITGATTFVNTGRFTQTGSLRLVDSLTFTLINNITVLNDFISTNNGSVQTLTGFQLTVNGGITTTGTGNTSGTTTILLNGTGTWQGEYVNALNANAIRNNTTINTAGTITFSGYVYFNTGTLTYTAGTVITTGSTLACFAATTLNTDGISWDNVHFIGTMTLSSPLTVTGTTSIGSSGTSSNTFVNAGRFTQTGRLVLRGSSTLTLINNFTVLDELMTEVDERARTLNGFQLTCLGDFSMAATGSLTGTTPIVLAGTGTWAGATVVKNNLTVDTAGSIAVSGDVYYDTGTLTHVAGTVSTTGSTLNVGASATLSASGINWNNVAVTGTTTITLAETLNVQNDLILNSPAVTFSGASGFDCADLLHTSIGTVTLASGTVYEINNFFESVISSNTNRSFIQSSTPGVPAILTLASSANQSIGYLDATDIDSSLGKKIWPFKSTLTNTENWQELTASDVGSGPGTGPGGPRSYAWVF